MVKLAVDNLTCVERIRNIIIRLKREISASTFPNQISDLVYKDIRFVADFIYDGVAANCSADFKYFIDLKNVVYKEDFRQYYDKYNAIITADERGMVLEQRQFMPSI